MQKTITTERLDIVDALRGFSLLGIVIVHFMEQYVAAGTPANNPIIHPIASDGIIDAISFILIRGKFFMLFSFLFGLSFAIQMGKAADKGVNFAGRFAWRLVILFAIGFLHNLFYSGDILTIFAVLGLPMILFYKVSNRWLLITAAVLLLGLPRLIVAYTQQNETPEQKTEAETLNTKYWWTLKSGHILDVFKINATYGAKGRIEAQLGFFGRGYQTFALFLIGLYAGRIRFFENIEGKTPFLKRILWWSLGIFLSMYAIGALLFMALHIDKILPEKYVGVVGLGLMDISNICQTLIYICGFMLLYIHKAWWRRQIQKLSPYGRMALTNYVTQTLIGTTLFFGFGFGLLNQFGSTIILFIALIVFIFQLHFSKWWLQRYHFGPLEWVWRSLTFMKRQPFKKS